MYVHIFNKHIPCDFEYLIDPDVHLDSNQEG
jgi:hypothetical protein